VFGEVVACPTNVPPEACFDIYPFELEAEFEGRPRTFVLDARRGADCLDATSYYVLARVWFDTASGDLGPFVRQLSPIPLLASAAGLSVAPDELVFNAFGRQTPPGQLLTVASTCSAALDWRVTPSAPWLHAAPASGESSQPGSVLVTVDVSDLDPAHGPFTGTLTFTAPGLPIPVVVPVTLNLAC
jgi:hypothetical protein